VIEIVGDEGGLIDDEETDSREPSDRVGVAGEGKDSGVVWELERGLVILGSSDGDFELSCEHGDFLEELGRLLSGSGGDDG
jgi:hypothetical protein